MADAYTRFHQFVSTLDKISRERGRERTQCGILLTQTANSSPAELAPLVGCHALLHESGVARNVPSSRRRPTPRLACTLPSVMGAGVCINVENIRLTQNPVNIVQKSPCTLLVYAGTSIEAETASADSVINYLNIRNFSDQRRCTHRLTRKCAFEDVSTDNVADRVGHLLPTNDQSNYYWPSGDSARIFCRRAAVASASTISASSRTTP